MKMPALLWQMIVKMTKWGAFGGAALGALYGIILAFTLETPARDLSSFFKTLMEIGPLALGIGAPMGAIFGVFAGVILGALNGVLVAVLTRVLLSHDWADYPFAVFVASALFTMIGGVVVFSKMNHMSGLSDFLQLAGLPALIAAAFMGYAGQRVAEQRLAVMGVAESVQTHSGL